MYKFYLTSILLGALHFKEIIYNNHALRCCKCVWNIMIITYLNSISPFCASYAVRRVWFILNSFTAEDEVFSISSTSLAKNALRSIWPQKTTSGKQEIYPFKLQLRPFSTAPYILPPTLTTKTCQMLLLLFFAVVIIRPSKQRNKF